MSIDSWITARVYDKPTTCGKCGKRFEGEPVFQAEVRMELIRFGESAAENLVNERYGEWHITEHGTEEDPF